MMHRACDISGFIGANRITLISMNVKNASLLTIPIMYVNVFFFSFLCVSMNYKEYYCTSSFIGKDLSHYVKTLISN